MIKLEHKKAKQDATFTVRIPKEWMDKIRRLSKREKVSVTDLIRECAYRLYIHGRANRPWN